MKTDYPELEGKKIRYYNGVKTIEAKVSGCNYHLGISVENDDGYLVCLNGKYSPIFKRFDRKLSPYIYRKVFHTLVKQIQNGLIEPQKTFSIFTKQSSFGTKPTAKDCPFAQ